MKESRVFGAIAFANMLIVLGITGGIIAFFVWLVKYLVAAFA